ncbi:MAG: DUF4159 domain-containing protein, partial [Planctomycetota bacterium]
MTWWAMGKKLLQYSILYSLLCLIFVPTLQSNEDPILKPSLETQSKSQPRPDSQPRSVLATASVNFATPQPLTRSILAGQQRRQDAKVLDAEKVRRAIASGVTFLKKKQDDDGSWPRSRFNGDVTALCTLALLNAGESPNDPKIRRALKHIRDQKAAGTYFVSLRIMAMAAADPEGRIFKANIRSDVQWLLKTRGIDGGWSYGSIKMNGQAPGDGSNSQFALLALHEASQLGIKIPQEDWLKMQKYWISLNHPPSGGFVYYGGGRNSRGSMTCAGISSLIIINENLQDLGDRINGDFANCCQETEGDQLIRKGFQWLTKHYSVRRNPGQDGGTVLYYLYGLERAGRLAGKRFVGPNDWYRDGANQIIAWQNRVGGYWRTRNGHGESDPNIATALALLFLSKGKRPVAIGKLDYESADWDLHPKGVHFLTRRLEKDWNMKLNWQTVKSKDSSVDDLLQTPVLFISGKQDITLSQTEKNKLKLYIENGGFVFAEACQGDGCGLDGSFERSFRDLMAELFPDSQLEPVALNHPIWSAQYAITPSKDRPVLALQACCRTSVFFSKKNLSCYWALSQKSVIENQRVSTVLK